MRAKDCWRGWCAAVIADERCAVRYSGRRGTTVVYYYCVAAEREQVGKQLCQLFGGVTVEQAVVEAVLESLSPLRLEAMKVAADQLQRQRTEQYQHLKLELERARYEADRCARQYQTVEPENRLVARTLEKDWNEALERVRALESQWSESDQVRELLTPAEHEQLHRLAVDLPALWNHPLAAFDLKKRILRTVIKEIVVYVEPKTLRVLIHWQGGPHTELGLRKRRSGEHRFTTAPDTVELIRQLARQMTDKQLAAQLNRLGIKTAKDHTWTRLRVGNFRQIHDIPNYSPGEHHARGELRLEEAATRLGVSYATVQRLIQRGQLPARQICPRGPWIILLTDVDALLARCREPDKESAGASAPFSRQQTLDFSEDI